MSSKPKSILSIFVANLVATAVFGSIWFIFNVALGNLIALRWLGGLAALPAVMQTMIAMLPSTGQLLFEESREYQKTNGDFGLDNTTLLFIAILSTTLDIVGPAWGIMLSALALGGELAVLPAVIIAFIASWFCQRIAWKSLKKTVAMTWFAVQGITSYPFLTKTSKRRGHSPAFQNRLEAPVEER